MHICIYMYIINNVLPLSNRSHLSGGAIFTFIAPCGFTHPKTRAHVRLIGLCFKMCLNYTNTNTCSTYSTSSSYTSLQY